MERDTEIKEIKEIGRSWKLEEKEETEVRSWESEVGSWELGVIEIY